MRGRFKRIIPAALALAMVLSQSAVVSRAAEENEEVPLYLKPDVAVVLNGEYLAFTNEQGENVFPVNYDGSTYLPVRAISSLMKKPIEWVAAAKMIFIGYSLSNLNGDYDENGQKYAFTIRDRLTGFGESIDTGYLKPDVSIYYDFEPQEFYDEGGKRVYPLNYNGSTYLPLRAIAALMDADIEWDRRTKTVTMTKIEKEPKKEEDMRDEALALRDALDSMETIYSKATSLIMGISSEDDAEVAAIAAAVSGKLAEAEAENEKAEAFMEVESYTEDETDAMQKVVVFGKVNEQYIQILENLAYMAAQKQDYSVLSDTFYQMALAAQTALEEAREAVEKCL